MHVYDITKKIFFNRGIILPQRGHVVVKVKRKREDIKTWRHWLSYPYNGKKKTVLTA